MKKLLLSGLISFLFSSPVFAAITRIGSCSAQTTSCTFSVAPSSGDVIIAFAHRDGSTTPPTLLTGYTNVTTNTTTSTSERTQWKISNGTETTTTVATNATSIAAVIYRGINSTTPIGTFAVGGAVSATMSYTGFTSIQRDSSSWVLGCGGHRSATNVGTNAPSGLSLVSSATDIACFDSNAGKTDFTTATAAVNASSGWVTISLEVQASTGASYATPALIQRVTSGQDGAIGQNATPNVTITMTLPNGTKSGNCLVYAFSYWAAGTITGVTDDKSNTWYKVASGNDGSQGIALYYAPNIASGTQQVKAQFSNHPGAGSSSNVWGSLLELTNVAQVATLDGNSINTGVTADPYTGGSITTTVNGDIILSFVAPFWNSGSVTITGITAGTGFTLASAQIHLGGSTSNSASSEYEIQSTAGAVVPATSHAPTATANQTVEIVSVALKGAAAGSTNTATPRIVDTQVDYLGTSVEPNMPFPCSTSGTTSFVASINTAGTDVSTLSDSANGSWQLPVAAIGTNSTTNDIARIAYFLKGTCSTTNTMSWNLGTPSGDPIVVLYSVVGLDSYDTGSGTQGNDTTSTATSPMSAGSITPAGSGEMLFTSLAISWNDVQSVGVSGESPVFQCIVNENLADGISGNSPLCEDNGHGYLINSTGGAKAFTWNGTHTDTHVPNGAGGGAFGQWAVGLAAFKIPAAGGTTCVPTLSLFGVTSCGNEEIFR